MQRWFFSAFQRQTGELQLDKGRKDAGVSKGQMQGSSEHLSLATSPRRGGSLLRWVMDAAVVLLGNRASVFSSDLDPWPRSHTGWRTQIPGSDAES
jgi:hypothetical protein